MAEWSLNGLKTLCEKEKLLVTSNFSFSHCVFKRRVLQTRENHGLFGKGLNWEHGHEFLTVLLSVSVNDCLSVQTFPQLVWTVVLKVNLCYEK